jgi:hypothetical protein
LLVVQKRKTFLGESLKSDIHGTYERGS